MTTNNTAESGKNSLRWIPLEKVWWEKRYRGDLGDIETLAESIKEKGVLQPITVSPEFELIAGERRVTAARKAGLQAIPALMRPKEDIIDARECELIENTFRLDFSWSEKNALIAEIDALYKTKKIEWSGRKTAQLLNKSVASVARAIKLNDAISVIPELRSAKTEDEALKMVKKLEEGQVVAELRSRQEHIVDKDMLHFLKTAKANYRVGDLFKELGEIKTGSFLHILECDPPYGVDLPTMKKKDGAQGIASTYNEVNAKDYPAFLQRLADELYRVAYKDAWCLFWFGQSWFTEVKAALEAAKWQVCDIPGIWVKRTGQTMQPEFNLANCWEPFFICHKGGPVLAKRGRTNTFIFDAVPPTKKYHPTERPIELMEEILDTFGLPGQTVFSPFAGSGVTLRAAYKCGMRTFGYDLNPEYRDKFLLACEEDARSLNAKEEETA